MTKQKKPKLIRDIWDAILNDKWMWIVVWGKPRCGKTTLQMQTAYEVYEDWDKVLKSFVWNLSGLLYKMDKGEPELIPTLNKLHMRIPILLYDDWGAHSNKAETQYDRAWDIFKGGFDVLGTKIAVLMASMVDPTEPTFQIGQKYTHEIFIPRRGVYKYDEVDWQQDYRGWKPKKKKDWIETNTFVEVPLDVYKQYDEMRMSLVDDVTQRIKDAMADTLVDRIIKRLQPIDKKLLEIIQERGMVCSKTIRDKYGEKIREAIIRCKARSLIVPVRKGTSYWYDITDLGLEVLKTLNSSDVTLLNKQVKEEKIKALT